MVVLPFRSGVIQCNLLGSTYTSRIITNLSWTTKVCVITLLVSSTRRWCRTSRRSLTCTLLGSCLMKLCMQQTVCRKELFMTCPVACTSAIIGTLPDGGVRGNVKKLRPQRRSRWLQKQKLKNYKLNWKPSNDNNQITENNKKGHQRLNQIIKKLVDDDDFDFPGIAIVIGRFITKYATATAIARTCYNTR